MKPPSSKRLLVERLGIKEGYRVAILHSPKGYTAILSGLPDDVVMTTRLAGAPFDVVQAFYDDQRSLKADLRKLRKSIEPSGKIWVCWRKGNVTDLSRASIHDLGESARLDSVAECALDEEWSAMKLMLPKAERKPRTRKK